MVALASIGCLSGNNGSFKGLPPPPSSSPSPSPTQEPPTNRLDILVFEAARTVSRLLNLYKSLSDPEISRLRKEIFKSTGIMYLNSDDEGYLLKLACTEKVEDLDKAASVVDRLGRNCSDFHRSFETIYTDIKSGSTDLRRFEYGSSKTKKKIRKLKKFLTSTLGLYGSMHKSHKSHGMSEVPEKKVHSPVPFKNMINFPAIEWMITPNRKQASDFRKPKLWTQPFDKVVRSMSSLVCILYARICLVFGPYVPDLPAAYRRKEKDVTNDGLSEYWYVEPTKDNKNGRPRLVRSKSRKNFVRFRSRKMIWACGGTVFHVAGPETVGGARLQILYANLIMMAEENMTRKKIRDDVRDEMYKMLPENLKATVKMKIRSQLGNNCDKVKMKEALKRIFMWLSPMATNTLLWQKERRVEMTTSFQMRPPVLLLQTLHFADKEKTEAAIVEVLVGLSFLYMHEKRRVPTG